MKQLDHMQAWYGNTGNGCEFMYSYESRVLEISGGAAVIFGRDAFYSTTTGKQISRYFSKVQNGHYPELCSAAGRRAALQRGETRNVYGDLVLVRRDNEMN